jgi:hypothetical protein
LYLTHWKTLIETLEKEWSAKYPDGKEGLFIEFKTENDALKYLLKAKRKPLQSRGDDVFGNSSVAPLEHRHSDVPEAPAVANKPMEGLEDELKELHNPLPRPNRIKLARRS